MPDMTPPEQLAALRLLEHALKSAIAEATEAADAFRRATRAKTLETDWGTVSLVRRKPSIEFVDGPLMVWAEDNAPSMITRTISTAAKTSLKARLVVDDDGLVIDTETGEALSFASLKPGGESLSVRLTEDAKVWAAASVEGDAGALAESFAVFMASRPAAIEVAP